MTNSYLINCQYGSEDIEKAIVATMVAGAAAAMESETVMFLTCESVRLATKGGVDGLEEEGYPALSELLEGFLENDGKLWVCPACAGARGITADDLIEGTEIAGAARTIEFVNDGAKLLM